MTSHEDFYSERLQKGDLINTYIIKSISKWSPLILYGHRLSTLILDAKGQRWSLSTFLFLFFWVLCTWKKFLEKKENKRKNLTMIQILQMCKPFDRHTDKDFLV